MRVLVLCDDYWHPGKVVRDGLLSIGDPAFAFDFIEDGREFSAEKMAAYPVTLLAKSNNVSAQDQTPWLTDGAQAAFEAYVRAGSGLLAMHSGTASYKEIPRMRALLGGVFDQHPPQCPVTVEPAEGHSLAEGSQAFTVKDEHYHMLVDDPGVDVFLKTCSEHGEQPGGWTRREGQGRVCVLTPGHNLEVWQEPAYRQLILNALRWCAAEA